MADQRPTYRYWTPDEDAFLVDMHQAGESLTAIAEALGRTHGSALSRLTNLTDPEGWARHLAAVRALNENTVDSATNRGERWTFEEDEFVLATLDDTIAEVAEALGRTYSAIAMRRLLLRRGMVTGVDVRVSKVEGASSPATAPAGVPLCGKCWTYHNGECL